MLFSNVNILPSVSAIFISHGIENSATLENINTKNLRRTFLYPNRENSKRDYGNFINWRVFSDSECEVSIHKVWKKLKFKVLFDLSTKLEKQLTKHCVIHGYVCEVFVFLAC